MSTDNDVKQKNACNLSPIGRDRSQKNVPFPLNKSTRQDNLLNLTKSTYTGRMSRTEVGGAEWTVAELTVASSLHWLLVLSISTVESRKASEACAKRLPRLL